MRSFAIRGDAVENLTVAHTTEVPQAAQRLIASAEEPPLNISARMPSYSSEFCSNFLEQLAFFNIGVHFVLRDVAVPPCTPLRLSLPIALAAFFTFFARRNRRGCR